MDHNRPADKPNHYRGGENLVRLIALIGKIYCKAQQNAAPQNYAKNDELIRYNRSFARATCVIGIAGVLSFGTAVITWIALSSTDKATHDLAKAAIKLAEAANKQVGVMQGQLDAMEREQQPFVWITDNLQAPQCRVGASGTLGQIAWRYEFTNFGRSYARNLMVDQFIRVGEEP